MTQTIQRTEPSLPLMEEVIENGTTRVWRNKPRYISHVVMPNSSQTGSNMYLSLGGHGSLLTPNKQQIEARNQKLTFSSQEAEAQLNYPSSEAVTRNDGSRQGANWKTCMPVLRYYCTSIWPWNNIRSISRTVLILWIPCIFALTDRVPWSFQKSKSLLLSGHSEAGWSQGGAPLGPTRSFPVFRTLDPCLKVRHLKQLSSG
ncbi:hypothetical protein PoMZ_07308, partial [Pyricularia oryzae]